MIYLLLELVMIDTKFCNIIYLFYSSFTETNLKLDSN